MLKKRCAVVDVFFKMHACVEMYFPPPSCMWLWPPQTTGRCSCTPGRTRLWFHCRWRWNWLLCLAGRLFCTSPSGPPSSWLCCMIWRGTEHTKGVFLHKKGWQFTAAKAPLWFNGSHPTLYPSKKTEDVKHQGAWGWWDTSETFMPSPPKKKKKTQVNTSITEAANVTPLNAGNGQRKKNTSKILTKRVKVREAKYLSSRGSFHSLHWDLARTWRRRKWVTVYDKRQTFYRCAENGG